MIAVSEAAQKRPGGDAEEDALAQPLPGACQATTTAAPVTTTRNGTSRAVLVVGVRLGCGVAERRGEEREAERRERDADPLAPGHLVGEEAVGRDREEDEAAGDRRLDERDRRQRKRAHVEAPARRSR